MTDYPFDMQLVVDPANPSNVVQDGEVTLYAPSDVAGSTPLDLKDASGLPILNPLVSNPNGFLQPFIATTPQVMWKSGPYQGYFNSYLGLRDEAIAARAAAEEAAATAGEEAAAVATEALASVTDDAEAAAASAALSATAAASSAALVGAPADVAIAAAVNGSGATKSALNAAYAPSALRAGLAAVTKRYDPDKAVYNKSGTSFRKWRSALAAQDAGTKAAVLALIGNSVGQGANSSAPYYITSWFGGRLVDMIRKRFPDGGYGFNPLNDTNSNADTRFTKTGTWTTGNNRGIGSTGLALTTVDPTATLTYTPATPITSFIINYAITTDGGSFTYTVNGGAPVTVNSNGAEAIGAETITVASSQPVIVITAPASGRLTLLGTQERVQGVGGVRIAKYAVNGSVTVNHTGDSLPTSELGLLRNLVKPDLTLIDLIINDWGHGDVSIAAFKANTTTLINNGKLTGDVALMVPIQPSDRRGIGAGLIPMGQTPVWADFVQATYDLADQFDLPVIDYGSVYGDWAEANTAGFMSDDYHPNDGGHRAIARTVFSAIFDNWQTLTPPAFGSTGTWTAQQQFNGATKFGTGSAFLQVGLFNNVDTTKPSVSCSGNDLLLQGATSGSLWLRSNLKMDGVYVQPVNTGTVAWRIRGFAGQTAALLRVEDSAGAEKFSLDQLGRPYTKSNLPAIAAAGGSAAASVSGNDPSMTVNFTTANGAAAGTTVATVTFSAAYASTPRITLTPLNAASVSAVYVTGKSATGFSLAVSAAQSAANAMSFDVHVMGG